MSQNNLMFTTFVAYSPIIKSIILHGLLACKI
jgi:hypothetical protein